jgi:leucyl/phenylalanyl-tRNA--protein transferase
VPVWRLDERLVFPPADDAEDGLLAVGGDLRPERLVLAYSLGIFPWYGEDEPILWHSPDPRAVLRADELRVPRSLRRTMRRGRFDLTLDTAFADVIDACAEAPRPDALGTWITADMREAYVELHRRGVAHSVEAWRDGRLAGGLYGLSLGAAFFGESMFHHEAEASKVAFVGLVEQLERWGIWLVDCQVQSEHLVRFGVQEWRRSAYLDALDRALAHPTRPGPWRFDPGNPGTATAFRPEMR